MKEQNVMFISIRVRKSTACTGKLADKMPVKTCR